MKRLHICPHDGDHSEDRRKRCNLQVKLVVVLLFAMFLMPTPDAGGSSENQLGEVLRAMEGMRQSAPAAGGYSYSGTGTARTVTFRGQIVNDTAPILYLDSSSQVYGSIGAPSGWTCEDLAVGVDSLSATMTDVLANGMLNTYHAEKWLGFGYNSEDVNVPDRWTLVENELGSGSGRNGHPHHGIWEMGSYSSSGYDGGSMGWRFEAGWSNGEELKPADEIYLSQQVSLQARRITSAQVEFMYFLSATTPLYDGIYIFIRCAAYEARIHAFEPGDPLTTWVRAVVDIPGSAFQSSANVLKFDIGISSDLSGVQTTQHEAQVVIDAIRLDVVIQPLPETIQLAANQTAIVGGIRSRGTPQSPDEYISGVSSRDCRSWPGTGLQLNGRNANGILEVGVLNTTTGGWTTTQASQIAFQFPLWVPQGSIITSAILEIEGASAAVSTRAGMRISVANEDNVQAFTPGLPELKSRFDWIPDSVDWYLTGTWSNNKRYVSPDFSALVQNLVIRPGWTGGNFMCVMLDYAGSADYIAYNNAKGSSNYNQEDLAKLVVDYIAPFAEDSCSILRYRKDLTIDRTKVSATLTDFPMLVDIYDRDLRTHAQQDGRDIKFMIGSTPLDHEIDTFDQVFNSTHAHLVCWVKIPTLSSTIDTVVSMYYGSTQTMGSQNPLAIWRNYQGVWHLSQSGGTGAYILDSGRNDHDGTPSGPPYVKTGKIAGARYLRGIHGDAVTPFNGEEMFDGWNNWQFSMWIYPNFTSDAEWQSQSDGRLFYKLTSMNLARTYRFAGQPAGQGTFQIDINFNTAPTQFFTVDIRRQTWNYVVYKYESTGTGNLLGYSYSNGALYDSSSTPIGTGDRLDTDVSPFRLGSADDVVFKGGIDEFRAIKNAYTSQAWIETEYRNQNSPSTFYSLSQEKTLSAGTTQRLKLSTSSSLPVAVGLTMKMNVTQTSSSLSDTLVTGTTYSAANTTLVNWTANVLVSPSSEIRCPSFSIDYPYHDWGPVSVTSPAGISKLSPTDWVAEAGTLTVSAAAIDRQGVWKIRFVQYNSILDSKLGIKGGSLGSTATFNIGQEAEFHGWTTWVAGEKSKLVLRDSSGSVWYSASNATAGSSTFTLPSFKYRKSIVVNHLKVAGTPTDFPVCVNIYDSDLRASYKVQPDADDLAFVSNGVVVPHEVELFEQNFNATHAHLVCWVKSNLSSTVDTTITMYYGNPFLGSQENPEAVWSNSYTGVWHMSENPTGTSGEIQDSSSCGNDATTSGSMSASDSVYARIGKGLRLDGINDIVVVPKSNTLDAVNDRGTLQLWINWVNAADGGYQRVLTSRNRFPLGGGRNGFEWASQPLGNHFFYPWGGNQSAYNVGPNPFTNGKWHQLLVTYDFAAKDAIIYVDGAPMTLNGTYVRTGWTQLAVLDDWLWGGNVPDYPQSAFAGMFDEIRVSDVVRSPQWIQTEFNCQNSPSTFCSIGVESQRPAAEPIFRKTFDSSAPAGLWTMSVYYNDTTGNANYRVGESERTFIVRHGSTLTLQAPEDAVADGISSRVIGSLLYVKVSLSDSLNLQPIDHASVTLNWSVSGLPRNITLDNYGAGVYGKSLNTSDLNTMRRWRINIQAQDQYYLTSSYSLYLDLFHPTQVTYESPAAAPYGDDFIVKVNLRDSFSGARISGAQLTSNGTIVGIPTDYGNGTYRVALETSGLNIGQFCFEIRADPPQPYLLNSSTVVLLTYRDIATDLTSTGTNPPNVPWGRGANVTLSWRDVDHGSTGVSGGTVSGGSIESWTSLGNGNYSLKIDTSAYGPGAYQFTFQLSKSHYQGASVTVVVNIVPHQTYMVATYNESVPLGCNTYFALTLHDLDFGGTTILSNFSQVAVQWQGGSSNFGSKQFWLLTGGWAAGTRVVNLTLQTTSSPRYYYNGRIAVQVSVRKLATSLTWDHLDLIPIGDDLRIVLHAEVDEIDSPYHGNPINGLVLSHFSAKNAGGGSYAIMSLVGWGTGTYNMTIDKSYFSSAGNFTIRIYLTFASGENYLNTQTPVITFTYRAARSHLSSPDYPLATMAYNTNVTITLNFADLDRGIGIPGATIVVVGAQVVSTTYVGNGEYRATLRTSLWNIGQYGVNLTASAADYQSQTISIDVYVRAIRTYAAPTVGLIEIPVGDSRVFYADFVDMDHNIALSPGTSACNWTAAHYTITWTGSRYSITIRTYDTDKLGDYLLMFNFTKGPNYEAGYFNLSLIVRTISTEFRLVSPVESVSPTGQILILVYYGDRDHGAGILSAFVKCTVRNLTGIVTKTWNNVSGSAGYYEIRIAASQFRRGTQYFTIQFNWTGAIQKYENKTLSVSVEIVGEGSLMTLVQAEQPSACLVNMSYTFLYSSASTGVGITNSTSNVFVRVIFEGASVDLSKVRIWETDRLLYPGYYTVRFNNTILGKTGLFSMLVFINWSRDASPYYTNRTDSISVRVLPRDTLLSLVPPTNVPYGENATFSFTYEDVTGGTSQIIKYNPSFMSICVSVTNYMIYYDSVTGVFTVKLNTSQFAAPLGTKSFTLGVTWSGIPFYGNITSRSVLVVLLARQTSLTCPDPPVTAYGDNATFIVTWVDVTGAAPRQISNVSIGLYRGAVAVPKSYYSTRILGGGKYEVSMDTDYFASPGQYSVTVKANSTAFYIAGVQTIRNVIVSYRLTILTSDQIGAVPFNVPFETVLRYQDLVTLQYIGNSTGAPIRITVLNGSGWVLNCVWRQSFQDYLLTVETSGHGLTINTPYVLRINFTAPNQSPFFAGASVSIPFSLRDRDTSLQLTSAALPTPYLEFANFTVIFRDLYSGLGITGATISLYNGLTKLQQGSQYLLTSTGDGRYIFMVNSTALGSPGAKLVRVLAGWSSAVPFYGNASLNVSISVTRRPTSINILIPPSQTRFLDNVTFTFVYADLTKGYEITSLSTANIAVWANGTLLAANQYKLSKVGAQFVLVVNSTVLSSRLINPSNYNLTIRGDWNDLTSPYYDDDSAIVRVTTSNRIGIASLGQVATTPMGNNVSLSLTFVDASTSRGVQGASIRMTCINRTGLIQNVDYWIVGGVGANAGSYNILIRSLSLGGIGQYAFTLEVRWNPLTPPYYANITGLSTTALVRLTEVSLWTGLPVPSTVAFHQNVSIIVNMTDTDRSIPVNGAAGAISVLYKSSMVEPAFWSIRALGAGAYDITVNITEMLTPGPQSLIIRADYYPYRFTQVETTILLRLRTGVLSASTQPNMYAGDWTFVLVNLTDSDANDAPLTGAILNIVWNDSAFWQGLGNGRYNLTLGTTSLSYGRHLLTISANMPLFTIEPLSLNLNLLSVPSELVVGKQTPSELFWGENVTLYAAFNDTMRNKLITSATVTYSWVGGSGVFMQSAQPGNYSVVLNTSLGNSGTTVEIVISAYYPNYVNATARVVFRLMPRLFEIRSDRGLSFLVNKGSAAIITVDVRDPLTGEPVTGVGLAAVWLYGTRVFAPDPMQAGRYAVTIDTTMTTTYQNYQIEVTATKANYLQTSILFTMSISPILSVIWFDNVTSSYEYTIINWSQVVRIGVYVLAPGLNESYPFATGISACNVTWESPELGRTGIFMNGTIIGGRGYFYFDFNTTETIASVHTFRILAMPFSSDFADSRNSTIVFIKNLPTLVISSGTLDVVWGWTGFVNLTYFDSYHNEGISASDAHFYWAGGQGQPAYQGNGTYVVWIDTSTVRPSLYTMTATFLKTNYDSAEVTIFIRVVPVPTELIVDVPSYFYEEGSTTVLEIPYGDELNVRLLYNDTAGSLGIPGANLERALFSGPGFFEMPFNLTDLGLGRYGFNFDTSDWSIGNELTYSILLSLENRTSAALEFRIRVVRIPSSIMLSGQSEIQLFLGENATFWVYYSDTWPGHSSQGISDAYVTIANSEPLSASVAFEGQDSERAGWYGFRIVALGLPGVAHITIGLNKTYYESKSVELTVSVSLSPSDIFRQNLLTYGSVLAVVLVGLAAVWVRVLKVPVLVRKINGLIRQLRRGRRPKPVSGVKSRQQILTDLFNELSKPLGVVRKPGAIPAESVQIKVPQIEELMVELSILTNMTPEELIMFRTETSKMKLSYQATFAKEVIQQEAIRVAREKGQSVEQVLQEVREERIRRIGGADTAVAEEPIIISAQKIPEEAREEEPETGDRLAETELDSMKTELARRGLPSYEIDALIAQARTLPREVGQTLLKTVGEPAKREEPMGTGERLTESEVEKIRKRLEKGRVNEKEIESIIAQARELPRELAYELLETERKEAKAKKKPAPPPEYLSEAELDTLRDDLGQKDIAPQEIDWIVEQAKTVPKNLVGDFLKRIQEERATPVVKEEPIELEDRLNEFELEDLRRQLEKRHLPRDEIESIVKQAKNLPASIIEELLKSIDAGHDEK